MSSSELIEDLRRKGQAQIDRIWEGGRRDLAEFVAGERERLVAEERRCALEADTACRAVKRQQKVIAQGQASILITRAEHDLNDRLFRLAGAMLEEVGLDRSELFRGLMAEIPEGAWDKVIAHPDDVVAAKAFFPDGEITGDSGILAGLIVSSSAVGMTVNNTLRKRLDRAWPILGPEILREVVENESPDGSAL